MGALQDFSRRAACRFLQSAVFVDDQIYHDLSGMPVEMGDLPKQRKRIFDAGDELPLVEAPLEKQPYHPKQLVGSFAREGIICALYEPEEHTPIDPESELFRLCERADIIILDWDLFGDRGRRALELIVGLAKQSHEIVPHHTRLVSIYTTDQSLTAVANTIADRLLAENFQVQPERAQCRLRTGAMRLLVLGKDIQRFGTDVDFTVKEDVLADRLIDEFADMNTGILPSYALHGMASIRRNSKRVLDRFHGALDGAFLLQRGLVHTSEEAFDQLPELLVEELLAIIEDERLDADTVAAVATDAINQLQLRPPARDWTNLSGLPFSATHHLASTLVKALMKTGRVVRGDFPRIVQLQKLPSEGFREIDPGLMEDLMAVVDSEPAGANQRLANLYDTRTQYDPNTRVLSYGAVVRHYEGEGAHANWQYSFCLMPACDSIRLNLTKQFHDGMPIAFPFWKLRADVFSAQSTARRGLVVQLADDTHIELAAGGKPRDMLWVTSFQVDADEGMVIATKAEDGSFVFHSNGQNFEWVAQIKPLHAQRIAHDVGQSLSRVAVSEAEWLRLLCDRS